MATPAKTMSISKELCDVIMLGCRCTYIHYLYGDIPHQSVNQ